MLLFSMYRFTIMIAYCKSSFLFSLTFTFTGARSAPREIYNYYHFIPGDNVITYSVADRIFFFECKSLSPVLVKSPYLFSFYRATNYDSRH